MYPARPSGEARPDQIAPSRSAHGFGSGIVLAASYVLCGKLALLLALPPGYASAIFPPAGIAVAAALIGGWRTLPWAFLGSVLLNVWVGGSQTDVFAAAALSAAGAIAFASTLQAALGGWILRRFVGYPSAFDKTRDVLGLLILAPVICLVSATLSVGGLTALGTFGIEAFATNWLTWWIGDTLGVIVMVPIVLALAAEPRRQWRRRIPAVVLPMALAFLLVVFVFIRANRWEQEESMTEFRTQSQQLADRIQAKFEEQELLLVEMDGFLSHDPGKPVTREEFRRAVRKTLHRFPMLQAIEWAPRVEHADRQKFEALQRRSVPDFQITDRDDNGRPRRAAVRASYFPVTYLEPAEGNRAAMGFDLASTRERLSALTRASARKVPVATAPLRLIQEKGERFGVLLLLGVGEGAASPGVVLTVLEIANFIEKALPADKSSFRLALTDEESRQTVYGEPAIGNENPAGFRQVLQYGERRYLLRTEPTPAYLARHRGWQSWTVLAVGLFGTGLLGSLLLLGSGYTARVEALVGERTEALARESDKNRFFLRNASDSIHILDAEGNVIEVSDSFCKSLGYRRDELIGMNVRQWDAGFSPEKLSAIIAAQLESREPSLFETRHRRKDGSVFDVEVSGMPLEFDGRPVLFNSSRDVTERKLAQQALREEEEKLRGLFDLSPLGIALTDMEGHFVDFNEAFRRITGYTEAELRALDYRDLTPKSYAEDERQQLESLARSGRYGPYEKEYVRKDGRLVPLRLNGILVVARDGRQYVWSIVEDISEWKAAERLLQEQRDFLAASRDDLNEAQRIAMLGGWVLDIRRNLLTWSDEIFRIFEIDSTRFGASYEAFMEAIHPDDRETVDQAYRKSLADRTPYDLVHRLLMPDGRIKYVRERCETHYDEDGAPILSRGTVQDITQIREAENALRDSEARLRLMTESITDYAIFMLDAAGKVASWNEGAARLKGYSEAEILGAHVSRFYQPDDIAAGKPEQILEAAARSGQCKDEGWRVRKDGSRFFADVVTTAMRDASGRLLGFSKITRDVTERMQYMTEREDLLRRLNTILDRLRMAQRIAQLGNWELDLGSHALTCSDEALRVMELGDERGPMTYEAFLREVHPDDRRIVTDRFGLSLRHRTPYEIDYRLQLPDGNIKYIHQRTEIEYGADGAPATMVGTVQDVTMEKLGEEALKESEQRFRTVADYTYDWEYWRGTRGEYLYLSPSCERVTGYSQQEFITNPVLVEQIVHPDDRGLMASHLKDARDETDHSVDFRIIAKDGGIRWIAHGCRPVFGRKGEFLGRRVSNRDITERKSMEKVLFESEERFRLISASAKDAIIIVGPMEEINYWNPAAESIFGYSSAEALGKNLHLLLAPSRHVDAAHDGYVRFIASGEGAVVGKTFETTALRKGGQEFPIELSISALRIKDQWQAVGIVRDITDRKEAEAKIRELAYYDTLTNLPNRRLLMDRLDLALSQAKRFQRSVGLIFLDLDDFKRINDTLGHEAGDDLLKGVAKRLMDCVRTGDTVCRQGGDEFVIVLTEIAHPADAARVAEKIIQAMAMPYRLVQKELVVTTSIGISVYPVDGTDDAQELMKKADIAMYAAKTAGRNCYRFFDGSRA